MHSSRSIFASQQTQSVFLYKRRRLNKSANKRLEVDKVVPVIVTSHLRKSGTVKAAIRQSVGNKFVITPTQAYVGTFGSSTGSYMNMSGASFSFSSNGQALSQVSASNSSGTLWQGVLQVFGGDSTTSTTSKVLLIGNPNGSIIFNNDATAGISYTGTTGSITTTTDHIIGRDLTVGRNLTVTDACNFESTVTVIGGLSAGGGISGNSLTSATDAVVAGTLTCANITIGATATLSITGGLLGVVGTNLYVGQINSSNGDGYTPRLWTGTNNVSFTWDGTGVKCMIDSSPQGYITFH